jgi:uncharacterized protein YdeI (YjbR/CyaY-like superfamily)
MLEIMEITTVFYARNRDEWRQWLMEYSETANEIWLQTHHKKTGVDSVLYDHAVEEALCFGWIDGIAKSYDATSSVQRYTPRRPKSFLSELNRQRIFKLIREGKMTEKGLAPIAHLLGEEHAPLTIPDDIVDIFMTNAVAWQKFQEFPVNYQKLRIGFVLECRKNNLPESNKRLAYLMKMSEAGKMYGTIVE